MLLEAICGKGKEVGQLIIILYKKNQVYSKGAFASAHPITEYGWRNNFKMG